MDEQIILRNLPASMDEEAVREELLNRVPRGLPGGALARLTNTQKSQCSLSLPPSLSLSHTHPSQIILRNLPASMDEEAVREELLNRGLADPVKVSESQLPHKTINLFFILVTVEDTLTIL